MDKASLKAPEKVYISCSLRNQKQPRKWLEDIKIDSTIIRERLNLPSLIFALLCRYVDMISRELDKVEHMAEEQSALQMKEEERRHRDHIKRKLRHRRQIEEVRKTKF